MRLHHDPAAIESGRLSRHGSGIISALPAAPSGTFARGAERLRREPGSKRQDRRRCRRMSIPRQLQATIGNRIVILKLHTILLSQVATTRPPAARMTSPVIQADSSDARNTASGAISVTRPSRPNGVFSAKAAPAPPSKVPAATLPSVSV
jgi:hypothetical protein